MPKQIDLKSIIKEEDIEREVNIQGSVRKGSNYTQLFVQIPAIVVDRLDIKKGDIIIFKVPRNDRSEYSIRLKRKVKNES